MKQFTFETRQKNVLFGLMALGAICLAASFFIDPMGESGHHVRFWTNLLHNSAFFGGIAFTAIFVTAATISMYAGWHVAFKRVWEGFGMFLPIGLTGIAIVGIGAAMGWHHLYHWADAKEVAGDKILTGKSGFLNLKMFFLATVGFGGLWYFFMTKFRSMSLAQDEVRASTKTDYPWYGQLKVWGAVFLPIAGFTSAAAIWLWLMSLDAHWYSTMFAWYTTASWWVSCVSATILFLLYLKGKGYFTWVTDEHLHDLGKFMFAFSIFWTYLWFSQYMLIWYANIGEETIYFRQRIGEFPVLFYGNILMNFILPFLILIRNDTKRKRGTLTFAATLIFIGHWWDFFQIVKIGPYKDAQKHLGGGHGDVSAAGHGAAGEHAAAAAHGAVQAAGEHVAQAAHGATEHAGQAVEAVGHGAAEVVQAAVDATPALDALEKANIDHYFHYTSDLTAGFGLPGFLEIGTFLGFAALFVWFVLNQLSKASLIPENDPFLEETLHHHA
jgi:hypothetical protein